MDGSYLLTGEYNESRVSLIHIGNPAASYVVEVSDFGTFAQHDLQCCASRPDRRGQRLGTGSTMGSETVWFSGLMERRTLPSERRRSRVLWECRERDRANRRSTPPASHWRFACETSR